MYLKTVVNDAEIAAIIFATEDFPLAECTMQAPCYGLLDIAFITNVFASV